MSLPNYLKTIDYSKHGIEITEQAKNIARYYLSKDLSEEEFLPIINEYFDWLVAKMKTINPKKAKRPKLGYWLRAML